MPHHPTTHRAAVALVAAALVAAPTVASAEDADDGYRGQVVAVDVTADVLMASCFIRSTRCKLGKVGALFYAAGGPTVHFFHDHPQRGFTSLGLRVGAPFLAGLLGMGIASSGEEGDTFSGLGGALIGVVVGALGAQVLDAALLAGPTDDPEAAPRMFTIGGSF